MADPVMSISRPTSAVLVVAAVSPIYMYIYIIKAVK